MRRSIHSLLPALLPILAFAAGPSSSLRMDLDQGHYLRVLQESDRLLALDPRDPGALAAKSQALSSLLRFPEAEEVAEKAIALAPALADAYQARGTARAGLAIQQKNFGSIGAATRAMADFRTATEMDPSLQGAWMSLAIAYQQLPGILGGSHRQALACAEALGRLDPAKGDLLRGTVYSLDGRWDLAEPCFQKALLKRPGDPQAIAGYLSALGDRGAKRWLGEAAQKIRLASEARRLLPAGKPSGRALEAICEALLDAGQGETAWRVAQEGLAGCDAPSLLRLEAGKIAARSGLHREEGLALLGQVLREPLEGGCGGYAAAHWRRGQILRDLGRKPEARKAAEDALGLDRKHSGAKRLIEELES